DDLQTYLIGLYQKKNICTAVTAINILDENSSFIINAKQIINGLNKVRSNTGLRGRWDVLLENPKVICDTAHNAEGLRYTMAQLQKEVKEKLHMVVGVVNDKDLSMIFPLLPVYATYYFCRPDVPRGMNEDHLLREASQFNLVGNPYSSVSQAYAAALREAKPNDTIYIGGSTFTVAEVI